MKALITGILGQDGSYLAEYLLELGYEVHGIIRSNPDLSDNLRNPARKFVKFHYGDLRDEVSLQTVLRRVLPREIYNLGGQVFVPTSWESPAETFDVNVGGLARILKLVEKICPLARVYQASSSEMYGNVLEFVHDDAGIDGKKEIQAKLDETHRMEPVSPYGTSKYAAHRLVDVYRKKELFVVAGILFNHESPRRGSEMVTRKITKHVAGWAVNKKDKTPLVLGNLQARRDWGFAGDYVRAMHAMLQQEKPEDFVVGMGRSHSVEDFFRGSLEAAGLSYEEYHPLVQINKAWFGRANELRTLIADATKARNQLNWWPEVSFDQLVKMMVESDMQEQQYTIAAYAEAGSRT